MQASECKLSDGKRHVYAKKSPSPGCFAAKSSSRLVAADDADGRVAGPQQHGQWLRLLVVGLQAEPGGRLQPQRTGRARAGKQRAGLQVRSFGWENPTMCFLQFLSCGLVQKSRWLPKLGKPPKTGVAVVARTGWLSWLLPALWLGAERVDRPMSEPVIFR